MHSWLRQLAGDEKKDAPPPWSQVLRVAKGASPPAKKPTVQDAHTVWSRETYGETHGDEDLLQSSHTCLILNVLLFVAVLVTTDKRFDAGFFPFYLACAFKYSFDDNDEQNSYEPDPEQEVRCCCLSVHQPHSTPPLFMHRLRWLSTCFRARSGR